MINCVDIFTVEGEGVFGLLFSKNTPLKHRLEVCEKYRSNRNEKIKSVLDESVSMFRMNLPPIVKLESKRKSDLEGVRLSSKVLDDVTSLRFLKNFMPDININTKPLVNGICIDIDNWISFNNCFLCRYTPALESKISRNWSTSGNIAKYYVEVPIFILVPDFARHKLVKQSETLVLNSDTGECKLRQIIIKDSNLVDRYLVYDFSVRNWRCIAEDVWYHVIATKKAT